MSFQRFEYLFIRYIEQRCTAAEQEELLTMISEAKYDEALQSLLQKTWNEYHVSHHLDEEKARLIYETILVKQQQVDDRPTVSSPWWRGMAAALIIGVVISASLIYVFKPAEVIIAGKELSVLAGAQHRYVKLPDGSTVILHAGSSLYYPDGFTDTSRSVRLEGQAYFDIVHDSTRPFKVLTGQLVTQVLGTAFNIRADPKDDFITVTVNRGKVQVSDGQKKVGLLTPNRQVTFNRISRQHQQRTVSADTVINWQQQDLFFDDVTMEEAAGQLENRFGLKVDFAESSLLQCRFTGTFGKGEKAEKVLAIICSFNNASYTIAGNKVMISGQGCK